MWIKTVMGMLKFFKNIKLVVFDFDGVITDNNIYMKIKIWLENWIFMM